jgi:hypothetical protein
MGYLATYWKNIINFNPVRDRVIKGLRESNTSEKDLAALCVLYLNEAGHKMANTLLSRFYSRVLENKENAIDDFILACKVVASFFTLWRSTSSNAGLDSVYRQILRGDPNENILSLAYKGDEANLTVDILKSYLRKALEQKRVLDELNWKNKAKQYLGYNQAKVVCKFVLFLAFHDSILDADEPGLMKIGIQGTSPMLKSTEWVSEDFKTIEHIAPQQPPADSDWDNDIYENDDQQRIGNLTLLPTDINSSAGNRRWIEKWIYYRHLAETDPENLRVLEEEASRYGFNLAPETIEKLMNTSYKHHIEPIVRLGAQGSWNKELIEKRTTRICDIVWERISGWLI